jgi:glycosyltransferase involved in cell wall biosynthesis
LPLAVASVFAQTVDDWELLLVDDGSRDDSLDFAKSLSDPRVRVVWDGRSLGLPARLNQIAELARGEKVARMDGDDVMRSQRLEVQSRYLEQHADVDVVASAAYAIDADNNVYGIRSTRPLTPNPRAFLGPCLLVHPTVMASREWFRTNPYDVSLGGAEDKELWCRTRTTTTFANITEPLLYYREAGNFRWDSYRRQKRMDARVVARYGPGAIGYLATVGNLGTIPAKLLIYRLMITAGCEQALVKMGSHRLTGFERDQAQSELDSLQRVARELATAHGLVS